MAPWLPARTEGAQGCQNSALVRQFCVCMCAAGQQAPKLWPLPIGGGAWEAGASTLPDGRWPNQHSMLWHSGPQAAVRSVLPHCHSSSLCKAPHPSRKAVLTPQQTTGVACHPLTFCAAAQQPFISDHSRFFPAAGQPSRPPCSSRRQRKHQQGSGGSHSPLPLLLDCWNP